MKQLVVLITYFSRKWQKLILSDERPNGKIVLYCFVYVHKKYKTRVGNRQIRILWDSS
jgi:hypothetical protein